ncbi:methionyl-tRNA formyltransferase [Kineosphaera limosa]|uniref:Methionyl-tRNA formyltransferase n=1 Tax=Kineosphaera limosa NBRC 100340 TaxID=1184609 RepID=K6XCF6_9MICO|nr:methionyl-tRNA formyltransferase [Kineosphaera limosa]NYD99146.1 methionyl-tRNA formyltransferase [Kineosphaera limosa]GAB96494.1 methionyl-tRNA formyltransferase [Kineosphaera limosa NBRC 100340]
MRLLFAGTPDPAVVALEALLASRHEVVAVLTRPDARTGRGRSLHPSPVKQVALDAGLEVLTPARPRDPEFADRLAELAPDAAPIVAYGGLIPPALLDVPAHGWINLHFSLLPAWRGAAPVQHALIAGDELTGATTFRLEEGLDTGPVLGLCTEPIGATDTAGDLLGRLAHAGARLLTDTLDALEEGLLEARPQPAEGVSLAPKLTVDDARVRWGHTAAQIDRRIRGCTPAPGAWSTLRGERVKLGPVTLAVAEGADESAAEPLAPGEVRAGKRAVLVGTGSTPVQLQAVQPPGKRPMAAADWARGARITDGERFE